MNIYTCTTTTPTKVKKCIFKKLKLNVGMCNALYGTAPKEHRLHVEASAHAHKHPGSVQKQVMHCKWGATVKWSLAHMPLHLGSDKWNAGVLISTC